MCGCEGIRLDASAQQDLIDVYALNEDEYNIEALREVRPPAEIEISANLAKEKDTV